MVTGDLFLNKMSGFISQNNLIKKGDTILVGFSGGPDSTALLHSLHTLRYQFQLTLIAGHVNYHLRGEESEADMRFAGKFCERHCIPLVIKDAKLSGKSDLENRARKIRYDFFNSLTKIYKINKIAVGHNKNDVVETMLLHLFRGSGVSGMKGILPLNNNLIRPLLSFPKDEIIDYLTRMKIYDWREDKSNITDFYTRNKVRNTLLPWLEDNINPKIVDKLYDNSLIFRETDSYLRETAARLLKKILIRQTNKEILIELSKIDRKKSIILFYLFKIIIGTLTGSETGFYQSHFKEITNIIPAKGSKMIRLPDNITVRKEYDRLAFINESREDAALAVDKNKQQTIDITKKYHVFGNKRILCKRINRNEIRRSYYEDRNIALLDLDKIDLPITVSHRKEGDRFVPMGMTGSKKLKDFFIDEKISKFERDRVLIFRDRGKIIWVAGLRIDNRIKIAEQTHSIILLKIEVIRVRSRKSVLRKKRR